jgi:hypothetical protein
MEDLQALIHHFPLSHFRDIQPKAAVAVPVMPPKMLVISGLKALKRAAFIVDIGPDLIIVPRL